MDARHQLYPYAGGRSVRFVVGERKMRETILALFRVGIDTREIARRFYFSEARIYRLLAEARELERASRG